jgi:hypothetical protein
MMTQQDIANQLGSCFKQIKQLAQQCLEQLPSGWKQLHYAISVNYLVQPGSVMVRKAATHCNQALN